MVVVLCLILFTQSSCAILIAFLITSHFSLLVAPRVSLQDNYYVDREQPVSLHCRVQGNPTPTINWTPRNLQEHILDKSFLNISKVQKSAEYTCTAENSLGKTSASTNLSKLVLATP